MTNKKLESLILSKTKNIKSTNKDKSIKKNKDDISIKEIIRLFLFLYSVYYYYTPVKILITEFISDGSIVNIMVNSRKLFFTIDSLYKFIYYLILYAFL